MFGMSLTLRKFVCNCVGKRLRKRSPKKAAKGCFYSPFWSRTSLSRDRLVHRLEDPKSVA